MNEDDGRMNECYQCGFNDEDYGCTCPHSDKWYACPIEAKKEENRRLICNIMTTSKNTAR